MFNLADILAQAQKNQGFDALSRQFGMGPDQVRQAMEALLPAFSLGLNRATQSPTGLANLFNLVGGANYAKLFENPNGSGLLSAGQPALTQIFGNNELTQAIARQTAVATGIGQEIMKQIMMAMASLIMGGLVKGAMTGQNPLAAIMSETMNRMMPKPEPKPDPITGMMGAFTNMMNATAQAAKTATTPPPAQGAAIPPAGVPGLDQFMALAQQLQAANPLLNPGGAAAPDAAGKEASGPRTLGQQAADTWTATMGRLFQTGRELQDQQLTQMEKLFSEFGQKQPSKG